MTVHSLSSKVRDPFFVNGLRSFELKEWTVMEGTLGVRVNLSDQTVEVT